MPDPGQRGGGELPPALVARRRDHRIRLRPGRAVEPLAHGRRRRQPAGGPPGSRVARRHPGLAPERAGDRGPLEHARPAAAVGPLPLPSRRRQRGGTGGRRGIRSRELARAFAERDPLLPLRPLVRARPGPGRHADPRTRPRDREGLRRDRGRVPAAVPGVERRRDRARALPRRTLAGLRAPHPGRHDLVQGPPVRAPHRALPARSPHRRRAPARRSHRDRPRRGDEDRARPPRVFLEPGQFRHLRAAGRPDRQGGRRERRYRGSPVRRRGAPPGLRTGPRRVRHLGGHLPGADGPLAGGFSGRFGGGLPRRRAALPDDAAGRRPRAVDRGRRSGLRAVARLLAGRLHRRLHLLGRHERAPPDGAGGRRSAHPAHGDLLGVHPPGVDSRRERHRGGARHRRPGARTVLVPEPPLRPGQHSRRGRRGDRHHEDAPPVQRRPSPHAAPADRGPLLRARRPPLLPRAGQLGARRPARGRDPAGLGEGGRLRPARPPHLPVRRRGGSLAGRALGGVLGRRQRLRHGAALAGGRQGGPPHRAPEGVAADPHRHEGRRVVPSLDSRRASLPG